jgi:hypothetical protein
MTLVSPFGPERPRNQPDAGSIAEDIVLELIERSKRLDADPADVASLVAFDLVSRLAAYGRATLPVILAALGAAVPAREALLRECNKNGEPEPPLNIARLEAIAPGACRLHQSVHSDLTDRRLDQGAERNLGSPTIPAGAPGGYSASIRCRPDLAF